MTPQRRRTAALLAVSAGVVLGPVLLAGPASASGTIPDEPPGGATCAPEAPATDCQQEPADPTPTPSATKATTQGNPQSLPSTGGSKPASTPTLAHTGSTTLVYGLSGGVLLLLGGGLVAAGRRTARA
jgi:hypothetical protein